MGTTGEKILHQITPNAHVAGVKTYYEAKKLLADKQVDAIFGDDIILSGLNKEKNFKVINKAYSQEFYAVAVRKSAKSKELLNIVNASIAELLDTKQINLIKKRWIVD
jgi:ABC-type amino acid transport substrate-binding protein